MGNVVYAKFNYDRLRYDTVVFNVRSTTDELD